MLYRPPFPRHSSILRQGSESLILLALAVTLFRGFAAEGYLISTGSMAPTLLGYHRRVVCPGCHSLFARGATGGSPGDAAVLASADPELRSTLDGYTVCPNCGLCDLPVDQLPRNEGDQLMVHKLAYEQRDPHRWEVVVFGNPEDPRQAYVKRVAGLPHEQIEIRNGNVYANGLLCRKPLDVQRGMRIPVSDFRFQPAGDDQDWQPCWFAPSATTGWTRNEAGLRFDSLSDETLDTFAYRHWRRSGGAHTTSVPLAQWPDRLPLPEPSISNLRYESATLTCTGVLTDYDRRRWRAATDDPAFLAAMETLFTRSHVVPIQDDGGYNAQTDEARRQINDLMVRLKLKSIQGDGRLELELTDGAEAFRAVLNFSSGTAELYSERTGHLLRQGTLPARPDHDMLSIEFSLFDDSALLALNGELPFEPFDYAVPGEKPPIREPLKIGGAGLRFDVAELVLYRDVHYTPKGRLTARLKADEFFVLGDNSDVSVDSRCWDDPAVPRRSLIGKPLVVHLPSRQGSLNWGGMTRHVRIPDLSRVRVIH